MEIKVNKDGEITLSVLNGETDRALEFVRALQADVKRKQVSSDRSILMKEVATKVPTGTGELNAIQYRTWEYLAQNDCMGGIHVSQFAHAFAITPAAANTRLIVLQKLGYAQRTKKGYYRALTPENG